MDFVPPTSKMKILDSKANKSLTFISKTFDGKYKMNGHIHDCQPAPNVLAYKPGKDTSTN